MIDDSLVLKLMRAPGNRADFENALYERSLSMADELATSHDAPLRLQRTADTALEHPRVSKPEQWSDDSAADRALETELERRFRPALDKLPSRLVAVLVLHYQEGLSSMEIASHLGLTVEVVNRQLVPATARMFVWMLGDQ